MNDPKELAATLRGLWNDKVNSPGIGPQTVGFEMYRLRASGMRLESLIEAAEILESLPQGGLEHE